MMNKILIVDFDDSFTFNIAEICRSLNLDFEVLNFKKLSLELIQTRGFKNIIWGPGPGHPEQYPIVLNLIEKLLDEDYFHLGVCLGHQLIFRALGFEIIEAPLKRHGRSSKFIFPNWDVFPKESWGSETEVQFYSSLAVRNSKLIDGLKIVSDSGVITSGSSQKFLSYQFHPESVGTSCPEGFFRVLKEKMIQ